MAYIKDIKKTILTELSLKDGDFSYPPDSKLGDLSLACFTLAKEASNNPAQVALDLQKKALESKALLDIFLEVKAVGPYLNFFFKNEKIIPEVLREIRLKAKNFGYSSNENPKSIMIEYSNGNTHKEYHVGHLRNISYGESIKNILKASGCKVIPVSYINDFGIHTAKTIWNWKANPVYEERPEDKGYLLGRCYSEASLKLAKQKEEGNKSGQEEVSLIMKSIESRQGSDYELWKKTRNWSINYFNNIYKELNISFLDTFYESEVIDDGLKMVDDLTNKGILKLSEGAIIADLEEFNLGVLPVIRSDKTALYPVADLALASKKFNKYKLDASIYVVDVRQGLHFKQLFKVLELAGYKQPLIHLSYDFVTLPEGMMASRTGNVITYEDLKSKIFDKLFIETKKRHDNWTDSRLKETAMSLTMSIIKFEMLKVGAEKIITFNIEEAARFEGFTACYLQYTYARLRSLVRKAGLGIYFSSPNLNLLQEKKEKDLILKAARFPEILQIAAEKYNPSEIAKFLFEFSKMINDYYHEVNILKAEKKIKLARLALVKSLSLVLVSGFSLLGIEALEEM